VNKEFHQWNWNPLLVDDCRHLIRLAIREDLDQGYDWTTVALVPDGSRGSARLVARESGVAAGLAAISVIIEEMEADIAWHPSRDDGQSFDKGECLGQLAGSSRDLLTAERLILNLVSRLTGIATITRRFVQQLAGTTAQLYDTRKTCPGYRRLEKYAVRCGGGHNHRAGLFDAILIKDNHLALGAGAPSGRFAPAEAVAIARRFVEQTLPADVAAAIIIEIEVDSLDQLEQVLPASPDIVLLDNMTPDQLREAVRRRDRLQSSTALEASGGVNLETIALIAQTGVERISAGAITHAARSVDIGLDWVVSRGP
jgi:nicotinate-nucleotide pyrophosphorylase (carboxylating)